MTTWFLVVLIIGGFYPHVWMLKRAQFPEFGLRFIRSLGIAFIVQMVYRAVAGDILLGDGGVALRHYTSAISVIYGMQLLLAYWTKADIDMGSFDSVSLERPAWKAIGEEIATYRILFFASLIPALLTWAPRLLVVLQS